MEDFPRDMLLEVLSKLPVEDLSASSRVCRLWASICRFPNVLQSMQQNSEAAITSGEEPNFNFKLELFRKRISLGRSRAEKRFTYDAILAGDVEALQLAKADLSYVKLIEFVSLPGGIRKPLVEAVFEGQHPQILLALASCWTGPEKAKMVDNAPIMPYIGNQSDLFFSLAMKSVIEKFAGAASAPLSPFQETFVKLIRHFQREFWTSLLMIPIEKQPPTISQVVGPPLNLDPKADLTSGIRPYHMCTRGAHLHEFAKFGIDLSSLWPSALRSYAADVVWALLDLSVRLPSLSVVLGPSPMPRDVIGRVVRACLASGASPSAEDFRLAAQNRHVDVVDLFTLMGIGKDARFRPSFPQLPNTIERGKFVGRMEDQPRYQLQITFDPAGTYAAKFSIDYQGGYGFDWPDDISWSSTWKVFKPKNEQIANVIECKIPADASNHQKARGKIPSGAYYFVALQPGSYPYKITLFETRPENGSPEGITCKDLVPAILLDPNLFRLQQS
eukprot:TRINITY_DN3258_c0_g1_i2.p1 TRINITY_DN3258_c0_g1~~TRINITY_DN3258_c0_g1_i2.p1  ORF type:complete len:502 (-),score=53.44 TRINITY_DN3258_c0_g1_i2:719-2224(-)